MVADMEVCGSELGLSFWEDPLNETMLQGIL